MPRLIILILLFFCSVNLLHSKSPSESAFSETLNEEYDQEYFLKLRSVNDVILAAEEKFGSERKKDLAYFNFIAEIMRKRFYHGYSHYSFEQNALAKISGLVWNDLSAIVIPDDIMKFPMAACSQQAIVMVEIFRRLNIPFRHIGLPGHYVVEAFIDNEWRYFDTNKEPNIQHNRRSFHSLIASSEFDSAYIKKSVDPLLLDQWKNKFFYGAINEKPAPNASKLHIIGYGLQSKYYVMFLFIVIVIPFWLRRRNKKRNAEKSSWTRKYQDAYWKS